MAYSSTTTRSRFNRQELYNYVNWSSNFPMEDEDDLASYFERFQTLSDPLLFFRYLSKKECNKLFWQGFHPDDYTTLFPYLIDKCPNQLPGDFDF